MSLIQPPGTNFIIQSLLNSPLRAPDNSLTAASIGVIVAIIIASILLILILLFVAYWCPFVRCFWAFLPCVLCSCCNCIYCFYCCCPCLDALALKNLEVRSKETKVYIQDMFTTPDGKIIHMSNMGPVMNCPRVMNVGARAKIMNGDDIV